MVYKFCASMAKKVQQQSAGGKNISGKEKKNGGKEQKNGGKEAKDGGSVKWTTAEARRLLLIFQEVKGMNKGVGAAVGLKGPQWKSVTKQMNDKAPAGTSYNHTQIQSKLNTARKELAIYERLMQVSGMAFVDGIFSIGAERQAELCKSIKGSSKFFKQPFENYDIISALYRFCLFSRLLVFRFSCTYYRSLLSFRLWQRIAGDGQTCVWIGRRQTQEKRGGAGGGGAGGGAGG